MPPLLHGLAHSNTSKLLCVEELHKARSSRIDMYTNTKEHAIPPMHVSTTSNQITRAEFSVDVKATGDTRAEPIHKIKVREGSCTAGSCKTLATQSTRDRSPHGTRASFLTQDVFTQDDRYK